MLQVLISCLILGCILSFFTETCELFAILEYEYACHNSSRNILVLSSSNQNEPETCLYRYI